MLKKAIVLGIVLVMISTVGFAAPMTDFSAGKWQLDATMRPDLEVTLITGAYAKTNWDFGVTAGVGGDWAVQYKYNSSDIDGSPMLLNAADMRGQELNLLYKLDKNSSAFIGATSFKFQEDNVIRLKENGFQVGLQTTVPFTEKTSGFVVASVGNKVNSFEIGLAYKAATNVDVNISYVDRKYQLPTGVYDTSYTAKGVGLGISYRF